MKKLIYFSFLALGLVAFTGCNKYEEGSKFTLLTAKMRLTNNWTSTSYVISNSNSSTSGHTMDLTITKEGSFTAVNDLTYWPAETITGTWTFDNAKENVIFTDSDGESETWKIIKLKDKELKLENVSYPLSIETTTTIEFVEK